MARITRQASTSSAATASVANVNDAPTGAVTIAGTATEGQTLTASNTLADADGLGTIGYQWLANGTAISGATGSTLTLAAAQIGKTISVRAAYTDGQGTAEHVDSGATASVAASPVPKVPTYTGTAAAETIQTTAGNDFIDGGAGLDHAVLHSARAQNTITNLGDGIIQVTGPEGTDTFTHVERLVFSDMNVGFDVDGMGGKTFRLYKAAYDREPDPEGLGFWLHYLDNGFDMKAAADNFLNQTEFRTMYDTDPNTPGYQEPSNEQYCYLVYKHVLQREPDPEGYLFWVGAMSNEGGIYGKEWSKGEVLILFAESIENQANTAELIGQGFEYLEFSPG